MKRGPSQLLGIFFIAFSFLAAGCGPEPPIRLGFISGTAGHTADMGISARYGAQLALDQCNETGGIQGRRVELVVRDGQNSVEDAVKDVKELIAQEVEAIIGPMSSTMAMAVLPYVNAARVTTVSPTATTPLLSGRDDYFFRICTTASESARVNAGYQIRSGKMRRVAIAFHGANPAFCEPFMEEFKRVFHAGGGEVLSAIGFTPEDGRSFSQIAQELLAAGPDGILILANAMDSAMLCQQIRKISPSVELTLSNWSTSQQFVEMGGRAVEGATLVMSVDWDSPNPRYQKFRKNFFNRYQRDPRNFSFYAYNAVQVVLTALDASKPGQSLKDTILSIEEFDGLQGKIRFDAYGDVERTASMRIIRNHKFIATE